MLPNLIDFVEILRRPEGKTLGFKRDLSSPEGAQSIVAFAMPTGGMLRSGLDHRSYIRDVSGALDRNGLLSSLVTASVGPRILLEIGRAPRRRYDPAERAAA